MRPQFLLATAVSTTRFVTGIVDVTRGRPARLLDVVDGRFGPALAGWLSARDPGWKQQVGFAALDPFHGYANALRTELGEATRVLDTVRLGLRRHRRGLPAHPTTDPVLAWAPRRPALHASGGCYAAVSRS